MNLKERIDAFTSLGEVLRNGLAGKDKNISGRLSDIINQQHTRNEWFTPENVRMSLNAIAENLTFENLTKWTSSYPGLTEMRKPFRIGVIMAGNIPLVGFHDYLSVLISGNDLIAKTSSKDKELILFINDILCTINPEFREKVKFTESTLTGFDAIIATGSDNSSRYFEYYFGKYPNIIRKSRNSIAIIDGNESEGELNSLGKDIFSYFGLGCRNVSKIFVPEGYDFSLMTNSWEDFSGVINNIKYASNYDFNKAVYLVNKEDFIDTGYLLLKENYGLSSPVAVVYYEYYNSPENVLRITESLKEKIQCIIGRNTVPFGKAHSPDLWNYADEIDTLEFLLKKNSPGIL
jgi:hypothetical protein